MDITLFGFLLFALLLVLGIGKDSGPLTAGAGLIGILLGIFFLLADSAIMAGIMVIVGAYCLFEGISEK